MYLIGLYGQKLNFLPFTPILASILASTFQYHFPFITKALRERYSKSFFAIKLKFKLYQIHLVCHKLIRKMGVNSSDKAFRTIPHPSIYNIRSYVLHAGCRKGMTQVILCNFFNCTKLEAY